MYVLVMYAKVLEDPFAFPSDTGMHLCIHTGFEGVCTGFEGVCSKASRVYIQASKVYVVRRLRGCMLFEGCMVVCTGWLYVQASKVYVVWCTGLVVQVYRRCTGTGVVRVQALYGYRLVVRVQALYGYRRCTGTGVVRVQAGCMYRLRRCMLYRCTGLVVCTGFEGVCCSKASRVYVQASRVFVCL